MMDCVMVQVYPKLGQTAHTEVTVNKEPLSNELSAECQPCLHLIAVQLAGILKVEILRMKGHLSSNKIRDLSRAWK